MNSSRSDHFLRAVLDDNASEAGRWLSQPDPVDPNSGYRREDVLARAGGQVYLGVVGDGSYVWRAIHLAQSPAMVRCLVAAGADPNGGDAARSPLVAYKGKPAATLKALLKAGASITSLDNNQETALHAVCYQEGRDVVRTARVLLQAGASANATNQRGLTPLHIAAMSCSPPSLLRLLLQNGADPTAQDEAGDTVVHMAASSGNAAKLATLAKQGVSLDLCNQKGRTALGQLVNDIVLGLAEEEQAQYTGAMIQLVVLGAAFPQSGAKNYSLTEAVRSLRLQSASHLAGLLQAAMDLALESRAAARHSQMEPVAQQGVRRQARTPRL